MSLAQTQDTLTQDPGQLQQRAGQGDLFAMAKLYKMMQGQQAAQVQQGLAQQSAPPVKQQIMQAVAQHAAPPVVAPPQQPPAPTGIAAGAPPEQSPTGMAAGGFVQRRFDDGGMAAAQTADGAALPHDAISYGDDRSPFQQTLDSIKQYLSPDTTVSQSPSEIAKRDLDNQTNLVSRIQNGVSKYFSSSADTAAAEKAQAAKIAALKLAAGVDDTAPGTGAAAGLPSGFAEAQRKHQTGSAGIGGAAPQVAVKPTGPKQTGSGLADALPQDVTPSPSGPPNRSKVDATSEDQPVDTPYQDRATNLLDQLSPLQQDKIKQYQAKQDAENAAYAAAQAAKHDPNKFADAMNRIVAITHPFSHANVGARGNLGSLADGAYELARTQQTQREQQAQQDAAHQQALLGIQGGLTNEQIAQLTGNYNITNSAAGLDDKSDLAHTKQENDALKAAAALAEKKRLDDAAIKQKLAAAKKLAGGAGGSSMKGAMTPAQYAAAMQKAIIDGQNRGLSHEEAMNEARALVPPIGTPVALQSGAAAPASTGDLQAAAAAEIARRAGKK